MLISKKLNTAINEEIGREFEASHIYASMASYVDGLALKQLSALLFKQSDEERSHGMKFIKYVLDAGGSVEIPAIPAPPPTFKSVEDAIKLALDWELKITGHINDLITLAVAQKGYIAQDFLKWFATEQLEEVSSTDDLLKVVRYSGERNLIMIEAYLSHIK
jgi:bacterioferritin B